MKKKILVVDDSALMRRIIIKELQSGNYETIEAANGEEALSILEQFQPDLITLDVDMPKLDGFQTCFQIRGDFQKLYGEVARVPIVFVTASDTLEGRTKGFEVGATDFITKPFIQGEVVAVANRILNPTPPLENLRALVAEDSRTARQLIANILEEEGVEVVQVENGQLAFNLLKNDRYHFDLVITDFMMPKMNGDELCKAVRNDLGLKSLPIIFLTGMTERGSILEIFKAGATDYLIKPFAKEELLARLKVHLQAMILNRTLEKNVLDLKRLNKRQDDILAVTSHDLRAPLNGVLGFAELLRLGNLDAEQQSYIEHIKKSGKFLLSLINEILDAGKINAGEILEMKEVNIVDVFDSARTTLLHMATPKSIEILFDNRCQEPPLVLGNANGLMRVFNNFLSNGIKFTPKGGKIIQRIEVTDDKKVKISTIDTGLGIPADKIAHLFDKYTKASRAGTDGEASTGLGLSITKDLVEMHDGEISVESVEGQGSTFIVTIPQFGTVNKVDPKKITVEKKTSSSNHDVPRTEQRAREDFRCLLVDDNDLNLKLAKIVLSQQGYMVSATTNGQEACDELIANINTNPYDIVLMDIHMPVMDGVVATKQIREYFKEHALAQLPIIAMTAGTSQMEIKKCMNAGMTDILEKPVSLVKMQTIMETYLTH